MTSKYKTIQRTPAQRALIAAIAVALAAGVAPGARALEFGQTDAWHGTLNTTVSYGVDVRVQDQDADLIAKAHYNPFVGLLPNQQQREAKGAFSIPSRRALSMPHACASRNITRPPQSRGRRARRMRGRVRRPSG